MSIQVGGLRFSYSGALSNIAFLGVASNAASLLHHEVIYTWASSEEKNALQITLIALAERGNFHRKQLHRSCNN